MDELHPAGAPHDKLIQYVTDRPATMRAMPSTPPSSKPNWAGRLRRISTPAIEKTVKWYLENRLVGTAAQGL